MKNKSGLSVNLSDIPDEMKELDNWVGWKYEERDGKETKVLYNPITDSRASATDPDTWVDFETVKKNPHYKIGFVLTNSPFTGIDLDDCRSVEDGKLDNEADKIVDYMDSYTEISPSGSGVHIIVEGELPGERNRDKEKEIELYDDARYFTVTGHVIRDNYTIEEREDQLDRLYHEVFGSNGHGPENPNTTGNEGTDLSDQAVIEKARNASNSAKFKELWNGNTSGYPSQSEADLALCSILAFYTGGDYDQIDRLFRQSDLVREKWTNRPDYRDRTITKALEGTSEYYEESKQGWKYVNFLYAEGDKKDARYESAQVLMDEKELVAFQEGDTLLKYNEDEGIWEDFGREWIMRRLQSKLNRELSNHEFDEIFAHVTRSTLEREDQFGPNNPALICLQNGVFDLEQQELLDHSPKYQFRHSLPVTYDPEAQSDVLDDFLESTLEGDDTKLIEEIAGYTLYRDYFIQKAFMFIGAGANGKGVTLDLIGQMLGDDNIANKNLQQLTGDSRFSVNSLYKKYANIAGDLPKQKLGDTGLFKMLTGQDLIEAEIKYARRGIKFRNYATMLFSANKVPQSPDDTDAFHRRWVLVNFPYQFVNDPTEHHQKKRDPKLREKLKTDEVTSAFFNRAVEGLHRLLDNGHFTYDPSASEARKQWQRQSRPIKAFVEDRLEVTEDEWEFKKDVYEAYKDWCKENEVKEHDIKLQSSFSRELKKYVSWEDTRPTDPETGNRKTAYDGLQLREDIPF